VHPDRLVVSARAEPQLDGRPLHRHLERQEITTIQVLAVRRNGVDLGRFVSAVNQALRAAAAAPSANQHDITVLNRPFALDTKQPRPEVEDEVVALVAKWL
jgi:hypothetical protein